MKQVIVIRGDLGMSIGKVAAQACHASVAAAFAARHEDVGRWLEQGQTKVVLQAPSPEALLALQERCRSLDTRSLSRADFGCRPHRTLAGNRNCSRYWPGRAEVNRYGDWRLATSKMRTSAHDRTAGLVRKWRFRR